MLENKRINILFIFHDSNYLSGATHSLMDIIDNLIESNCYQMYAVIPKKKGSLVEELEKRG